jgi:hypothetical protein
LPLENHSEETCPVQFLVWACVEAVDATKSAIVASNPQATDFPPARAGDAVPWRDPMEIGRCDSRPIPASN